MKGWTSKDLQRLGVSVVIKKESRFKQQWVTVGGKRFYARSKWEANYGRYLQWQKEHNLIREWDHEPETLWFEGIARGVNNYLPDFRVITKDGRKEFHEVKGYMDSKSKTKINRFRKYYPQYKLLVITGPWFKANSAKLKKLITGWD
jgi:hypothetical protein